MKRYGVLGYGRGDEWGGQQGYGGEAVVVLFMAPPFFSHFYIAHFITHKPKVLYIEGQKYHKVKMQKANQ